MFCDCEGDVGKAVCGADLLAESLAIFRCVGLVLDVVALRVAVDVVGLEVDETSCEIGVGSCAVVALVEIVREDLPVKRTDKVPGVVELVVIEVELVKPVLLVDVIKSVLPRYLGLLVGVHIDPDESVSVDAHVDGI